MTASIVLLAAGCAAEVASPDAVDAPVGEVAQAFTPSDAQGYYLVFFGGDGALRVDPLGPVAMSCLSTNGEAGCPVARLDFRDAGLAPSQQRLALERVASGASDESRASALFKGRVTTVRVNDHRTGRSYDERRFMVDRVYLAPQERAHATSFFFLYEANDAQYGVRMGTSARPFPSRVVLSWAPGVSGPAGVLDDAIVTGIPSPVPDQPLAVAVRADQHFTRL